MMDSATFNRLYATHYGMLLALAAHWGVPPGEREDIVQEAYLRAWQSGQEPQGDGGGWLWTITRHILTDRSRHLSERAGRGDLDITLEMRGTRDDVDTRIEVDALLAPLSRRDRHIVRLLMAGYSGAEIGRAMGTSKVTISRHFKHARAVMRGHPA